MVVTGDVRQTNWFHVYYKPLKHLLQKFKQLLCFAHSLVPVMSTMTHPILFQYPISNYIFSCTINKSHTLFVKYTLQRVYFSINWGFFYECIAPDWACFQLCTRNRNEIICKMLGASRKLKCRLLLTFYKKNIFIFETGDLHFLFIYTSTESNVFLV